MGIKVEENFNHPYKATNIVEFWQRWHMTLSNWCKDYVFTPVLAVYRKPFLAVICAMCAMGLWHQVSIYYLLWGFYHASGIACCRLFQNWRSGQAISLFSTRSWRLVSWVLTMVFIVSGSPIINGIQKGIMGLF